MNLKVKIPIFLILALLIVNKINAVEESFDLKLNNDNLYHLSSNSHIYFKVVIKEKIENKDLIVVLKPTEEGGNPDMAISLENKNPTLEDKSNLICDSYGFDICLVSHKNITSKSEISIGVYCKEECSFHITPNYEKEKIIAINPKSNYQNFYFNMGNEDSESYEIFVPKMDIHEVIITMYMYSYDKKEDQECEMYLNIGENFPSSNTYDYKVLI